MINHFDCHMVNAIEKLFIIYNLLLIQKRHFALLLNSLHRQRPTLGPVQACFTGCGNVFIPSVL